MIKQPQKTALYTNTNHLSLHEALPNLCEKAEALENESNIVSAFKDLQTLHEDWKEIGPVAKDQREQIWDRFKAATSVINKKHQSFFENLKETQKANLTAKTQLCEQAEEVVSKKIESSNEWNSLSKQMEELQAKWKTIGFASKKDNQKIYDRFRVACDAFYNSKREYYADFKNVMQNNLANHCIGSLPELFDGNPPFKGRGAVSFAMNVAEILRILKLLSKYNY